MELIGGGPKCPEENHLRKCTVVDVAHDLFSSPQAIKMRKAEFLEARLPKKGPIGSQSSALEYCAFREDPIVQAAEEVRRVHRPNV